MKTNLKTKDENIFEKAAKVLYGDSAQSQKEQERLRELLLKDLEGKLTPAQILYATNEKLLEIRQKLDNEVRAEDFEFGVGGPMGREWHEEDHPRDEIGRFTFKNTGAVRNRAKADETVLKGSVEVQRDTSNENGADKSENKEKKEEAKKSTKVLDKTKEMLEILADVISSISQTNLDSNIKKVSNKDVVHSNTGGKKEPTREVEAVYRKKVPSKTSRYTIKTSDLFITPEEKKAIEQMSPKAIEILDEKLQKINQIIERNDPNDPEVAQMAQESYLNSFNDSTRTKFQKAVDNFKEFATPQKTKDLLKQEAISQYKEDISEAAKTIEDFKREYKRLHPTPPPKGEWIKPVVGWPVNSKFNPKRINPTTGERKKHNGIDIAAPRNTPVLASADGIVTEVKWGGSYGNYVEIDHGPNEKNQRFKSIYAHLNDFMTADGTQLKKGQIVQKGEQIARVGTTGKYANGQKSSTGYHLHFEIRIDDVPDDPEKYIKNK